MTDDIKDTNNFIVRLLISHATANPDEITNSLDLTPSLVRVAGGIRQTPKGRILEGVYFATVWSKTFNPSPNEGIAAMTTKIIDLLELNKSKIVEHRAGGWKFLITLDLPGWKNIKGVIGHDIFCRLASLEIDFGLEVFP